MRRDQEGKNTQRIRVQDSPPPRVQAAGRVRPDEGMEDAGILHIVGVEPPGHILCPGRHDSNAGGVREGGRAARQSLDPSIRVNLVRGGRPLGLADVFHRHLRLVAEGVQRSWRIRNERFQGLGRPFAAQCQLCHGPVGSHPDGGTARQTIPRGVRSALRRALPGVPLVHGEQVGARPRTGIPILFHGHDAREENYHIHGRAALGDRVLLRPVRAARRGHDIDRTGRSRRRSKRLLRRRHVVRVDEIRGLKERSPVFSP
mmetsp:Transcript_4390/g.9491  ORF Transcript_4390/g.9491 Transcript_4390/m.9491 type:complete len:259 (-) Transcript_4390:326-1102(-)